MLTRNLLFRIAGPSLFVSLLSLGSCITAAIYLHHRQSASLWALDENLWSRRLAADLLQALEALPGDGPAVEDAAHRRISELIDQARRFADKPEEGRLVGLLEEGFARYLRSGRADAAEQEGRKAFSLLEAELVPTCRDLERFNSAEVDRSERALQRTLAWTAWGLAGVGLVGATAGVMLGYVVARGLGRAVLRAESLAEVGQVAAGLHRHWGTGKSASADGTKWDLHPQSLMTDYHIHYGGYGGIGFYLVSDTYIALFSRFSACGAYEGHSILDFVAENRSVIQPDTVHSDTHGQSTPIFGLAYLLGIKLMPRIRNWKDLHLYRHDPSVRYSHIDELFTTIPIDWNLIEAHLPDMLRVVLSIRAGRLLPSAILRRLATYSRKNRLYFAFRELGRVIRTIFLLRYLDSIELRRTINAATNKSEHFNLYSQWISFGASGLAIALPRDEQRKMIKYTHLVANLMIFDTTVVSHMIFVSAREIAWC